MLRGLQRLVADPAVGRTAQPDDEIRQDRRRGLQHAEATLMQEDVVPAQALAVGRDGGRRAAGGGLPVQKVLDFGDEVQVLIDQVPRRSAVRHSRDDHTRRARVTPWLVEHTFDIIVASRCCQSSALTHSSCYRQRIRCLTSSATEGSTSHGCEAAKQARVGGSAPDALWQG